MEQSDKDIIARLSRQYGEFEVVSALTEDAVQNTLTTYANNPGAVIHRDAATLTRLVTEMKMNHPLRYIFK